MTTGDEEGENLVDNLFRDVDDQFKDLEREYHQAREGLATADTEREAAPSDPLEASNERFTLMSQVASLQAEVSRQGDELDERDRMLSELSDKIAGFEADIARRDEMLGELHVAKQEALDERREQARLASLLDARAAERQELADVAQRLQNERDHVQQLLTTALARYDEVEALRVQMDDKVRHLEAARDTAAGEHDARAHELIESRAEMSKLADQIVEFSRQADQAVEAAEKSEALAERRANEAGYLNRRIDAMTDKLDQAKGFEDEASNLRRELSLNERRISELERELDTQTSEAAAAQAAVDAIAERTADYDELVAQVEQLTEERDAAWEAASGYPSVEPTPAAEPVADASTESAAGATAGAEEVTSLADRARELSARRANEAEAAAADAEARAAELAAAEDQVEDEDLPPPPAPEEDVSEDVAVEEELPPPPAAPEEPAEDQSVDARPIEEQVLEGDYTPLRRPSATVEADSELEAELQELDDTDLATIEADLAGIATEPNPTSEIPAIKVPDTADADEGADVDVPVVEFDGTDAEAATAVEDELLDIESIPLVTLDHLDEPTEPTEPTEPAETAETSEPAEPVEPVEPVAIEAAEPPAVEEAPPAEPTLIPAAAASRKRTILPADLVPNTAEAVAHLLNQPGVTAIIDARSTCGRTGIRPSELFERVAMLRDHFDVPVEVVVTPVSTPVGGAPDLPAIGVHHVTGADTVADRVRALCMGFPADQPLVVIAGDDHVRRAAIGQEANVVEPAAVLNVAAE